MTALEITGNTVLGAIAAAWMDLVALASQRDNQSTVSLKKGHVRACGSRRTGTRAPAAHLDLPILAPMASRARFFVRTPGRHGKATKHRLQDLDRPKMETWQVTMPIAWRPEIRVCVGRKGAEGIGGERRASEPPRAANGPGWHEIKAKRRQGRVGRGTPNRYMLESCCRQVESGEARVHGWMWGFPF